MPCGQFLKLRRNCSNTNDYDLQADALSQNLHNESYPKKVIRNAKKRARNNHHEALLETTSRTHDDTMTCVTTYTPTSNQVKNIILKHWNIVNKGELQLECPRFAFKSTQNLKDMLVHTRLQPKKITHQTTLWDLPTVKGHYPCGNCSVCASTHHTRDIQIGEINWTQRQHTNCITKN